MKRGLVKSGNLSPLWGAGEKQYVVIVQSFSQMTTVKGLQGVGSEAPPESFGWPLKTH